MEILHQIYRFWYPSLTVTAACNCSMNITCSVSSALASYSFRISLTLFKYLFHELHYQIFLVLLFFSSAFLSKNRICYSKCIISNHLFRIISFKNIFNYFFNCFSTFLMLHTQVTTLKTHIHRTTSIMNEQLLHRKSFNTHYIVMNSNTVSLHSKFFIYLCTSTLGSIFSPPSQHQLKYFLWVITFI